MRFATPHEWPKSSLGQEFRFGEEVNPPRTAARLARASEVIEEAEFAEVERSDGQKAGYDGQRP